MPEQLLTRRAPAGTPSSVDLEAGTATATLATSVPVERNGMRPDNSFGFWREVLDMRGVDLARLPVSLLLDHRSYDSGAKIGIIQAAAVQGDALVGALRFSRRDQVADIMRDVADFGAALSVGYRVLEWQREGGDQAPIYRATKWELLEGSIVNVPADPGARVRHQEGSMPETTIITNTAAAPGNPAVVEPAGGGAAAAELRAAHREVSGLYGAARILKVPERAVSAMLDAGVSSDRIRAKLFEVAADRDAADQAMSRVSIGGADYGEPDAIGQRMQAALLHRADPGRYKLPPEAAEFRGLSLVEMRRTLLGAHGVNCRGWTADKVLGYRHEGWMSRDLGGLMTTSDLPNLLTAAGNRLLEDGYAMAASPIKSHSRQRSASDFRMLTVLRAGNISALELVSEHGEVVRGQAAEAKESFKVSTYAKIWGFTRQAIINDDLGALTDWAQEMGAAAAETEASLFVELLTANAGLGPILDDGDELFHVDHGNYVSSGTAIAIETLSDGREAMRSQRGLNGVFPIGVGPVALLVSPANETIAEQVTATLQPDQVANANPFSSRLRVEVEARLSGFGWYLFSESPAFQHAYLNGQAGPMLDSKEGFDVLGVEFRCVLDVGAHVRDYRFVYHNAGSDPFAG